MRSRKQAGHSMPDVQSQIEMPVFRGLWSNVDPEDLDPGATQVQVNILNVRQGQLEVRPGLRLLTFEN